MLLAVCMSYDQDKEDTDQHLHVTTQAYEEMVASEVRQPHSDYTRLEPIACYMYKHGGYEGSSHSEENTKNDYTLATKFGKNGLAFT